MKSGTVLRLKLNHLKLYGRDKEVALLLDAYRRVQGQDAPAHVAFVHGNSGSGKTAIVNQLQEIIQKGGEEEGKETIQGKGRETEESSKEGLFQRTYFVSGKFDQQANAKPFSALTDALTELFDILIDSKELDDYKTRILASLGNEWRTVAEAVPVLAKLLDSDTDFAPANNINVENTASMLGHAVIRLKVLFRAILSALSTPQHPIVMFFDDLQFGDEASLDLIDSLFCDKELHNMLFIASYRDDEITDALAKLLQDNSSSSNDDDDSLTSIAVRALTVESINQLLADVTQLRPEETLPLACVVLRKTRGNIFFVLEFLKASQQRHLLYFSTKTFKWSWNVHMLDSEMIVSNNVVDLLIVRLQDFQKDVQVLLSIASCIGAQFDITLLATLYENRDEKPQTEGFMGLQDLQLAQEETEEQVDRMLRSAEEQELIMTGEEGLCNFAHDRVQQACYLLVPEGPEKQTMELRVGLQLLRLFHSPVSQRWMLFVAANNLNRASNMIPAEEKYELARLNLETAKKARQESAFLLAADYLRKSLNLLNECDQWTNHYKVTLELYTLSAEMEFIGGSCKRAEAIALVLIKSTQVHEDDKLPVYYTLMCALGDRLNLRLALDTGIHALGTGYGVTIPKRPTLLHFLWDLRKTKKLLHGKSDDDLLSLPKMTDEKRCRQCTFSLPCNSMLGCWETLCSYRSFS